MIKYNKILAGTLAMLSFLTIPFGNFAFSQEEDSAGFGTITELMAQENTQGNENVDEDLLDEETFDEETFDEETFEEDTSEEGALEEDVGEEDVPDIPSASEEIKETDREESAENITSSEEMTQEDGDIFVKKVTLLDSEGNEVAGVVSTAKRYRLRYDLISPLQIQLDAGDIMRPPYMEKGKEYLLPAITDDFINFTGSIAVKASDSEGNIVTIATVEIGDDGIPVFAVNADLNKGSILDGYFEIEVSLNEEKIGEEEDYIFTLPKGGTLQAEIEENKKQVPNVSKEAVDYDLDSNTVTWRITVQNPARPEEDLYPLKFSDVIGDGQTYVEDSFRVTEPEGLAPEKFEIWGNQMTWQYSDEAGNVTIQYEYQTKVDILALVGSNIINDDIEVSARNTLSVTGKDDGRFVDDITASWAITGKTPVSIEKSAGKQIQYNEDEDTGEIEWTIIVIANGYDISNLTVYDYFEAGTVKVSLKGEPVCNPSPVSGKGYDSSQGINNGKRYQWSYHIGDVSEEETYIITYTSVIENYSEYLKKNNEVHPRNEAWFDFYLPMGDGMPPKEFHGAVTTAEAKGVSANIIDKTGTYDPATHRVTWTIVVNPNQTMLPDAEITEKIPEGQRYISPAVIEPGDIAFTTVEDQENNTVTFSFEKDGLSGRTAVITLVTELEDEESYKWANNWSGTLENSVTLKADSLAEDGVTDVGRVFAKCMVIEKEMGAFNYAAHTIPVTITINQNNMRLTGAVVTDRLWEYGLKLDTEKGVQIDGISLREGTDENRPSYSYDGSTLTIYPEEVLTGRAKITFTVQATDEYMNVHRSEAVVDFHNIATLTSDQYGEGTDAKAAVSMNNRPVVKSGTLNQETGIITYTVEFNRTLADLPENLILTDTLPDGLLLKQSTVKLWEAKVDSGTGVMTKTGKEAIGYIVKVSALGDNIVMKIILPGGKQAYILEYDVQIVNKDKAPFVNRVDVSGYPGNGGESSTTFGGTQVAGARLENLIYIKVKKVDTFDMPLKGAVFALKQGDEQLLVGCTGEDGYITFVGVAPNTKYTIIELQTPEGYMDSSVEWRFTTGTKGGAEYALEETFVNWEASDEEENESGSSDGSHSDDSHSGSSHSGGNQSDNSSSIADSSGGVSDLAKENINSESSGITEVSEHMETSGIITGLPKTGGFRGMIYIIGIALLGLGVCLIISTFTLNMYVKWKNTEEISVFEAGLTMVKPGESQISTETDDAAMQEKAKLLSLQELTDENGVLAVLSIPSIACKEAVKEGSSSRILAKALGHMEGTALPGRIGNCVVAGHRNYNFGLYFNRLNEVKTGDEITVTTREGVYSYTVIETKVVEPEDVSVLDQTEDARLTLITCTPIYIASHRLIVVAEMIDRK